MGASTTDATMTVRFWAAPDAGVSEVSLVDADTNALAAAHPWRKFRWRAGQKHYSGTYWTATEGRLRLSTKRNRDIAARPAEAYGKLRPTRPGEYLLMDTTRLDVFALDPLTLRWVQAELTVGMDWYTRCVTGIRVTPVSTKSVDAAAVLYQAYRPRPPGRDWPTHAVWPEHGIPRSVLVDVDAVDGPTAGAGASGPAIVPETIVVDHGKIYVVDSR